MLNVQASNPLFYFQSIKIILGPSDAWLMRRSTQQPSVLYWSLLDFRWSLSGGRFYRQFSKITIIVSRMYFMTLFHYILQSCKHNFLACNAKWVLGTDHQLEANKVHITFQLMSPWYLSMDFFYMSRDNTVDIWQSSI